MITREASSHPSGQSLLRDIAAANDPQIVRIVATVDALVSRGPADQFVAPLRQRLVTLRPPRPLRFGRLMFDPLNLLVVPAARWRPGHAAIPRTALGPMAEHVRLAMGPAGRAIEARIAGHTDAEADLIARLGQSLWPTAAGILAAPVIPAKWAATELGELAYRPLANNVATLLGQAAALEAVYAETANGLLPPDAEAIGDIVTQVATAHQSALPMVLSLLLSRLPQAASLLPSGPQATAIPAAMEEASDLLLRQMDADDGTEARIGAGSLADAGAAVRQMSTLLRHLGEATGKPKRREKLRLLQRRLNAGCQARFAQGVQEQVLNVLQRLEQAPTVAEMNALETAARGLRVLETEARCIGGAATYDMLLGKAAEAISSSAVAERLPLVDQVRLVEILLGSEAAMALLAR